jgi:transcriptional regulator with XRE-family HTH domain
MNFSETPRLFKRRTKDLSGKGFILVSYKRLSCVLQGCACPLNPKNQIMHIGRNVSRLRNFRSIKQQDMAKRLGMTQQNYSLIENAENIDDDMLNRIAEIIEFPLETIKSPETAGQQSIFNSGSISDSIFYQNNPMDKIVELYERLLESEKEKVRMLERLLNAAKHI